MLMKLAGAIGGSDDDVDGKQGTIGSRAEKVGDARAGADLWRRPGYLIRRLHQIHVAMFLEECAAFSLTPVQYAVMTVLLERPERDQISIAAEAGIDRTNVADVLNRLEERGIVARRVSDTDRRMKLAALTPAGKRLAGDMEDAMLRAQDRLLAPLSPDRRAELMTLMTTLVDANNAHSRAPARDL